MEEVLWRKRQECLRDPGPDRSLGLAHQQDLWASREVTPPQLRGRPHHSERIHPPCQLLVQKCHVIQFGQMRDKERSVAGFLESCSWLKNSQPHENTLLWETRRESALELMKPRGKDPKNLDLWWHHWDPGSQKPIVHSLAEGNQFPYRWASLKSHSLPLKGF